MTSRPCSACPHCLLQRPNTDPSLQPKLRTVTWAQGLGCAEGASPGKQLWCVGLHSGSTVQHETQLQAGGITMKNRTTSRMLMWKSSHPLNASLKVNGTILQDGGRTLSFPLFNERQFNFYILKRNKVVFH